MILPGLRMPLGSRTGLHATGILQRGARGLLLQVLGFGHADAVLAGQGAAQGQGAPRISRRWRAPRASHSFLSRLSVRMVGCRLPSPACPKVPMGQVELLADLAQGLDHGRNLGARHRGVLKHAGGPELGQGGQRVAPCLPDCVALGGVPWPPSTRWRRSCRQISSTLAASSAHLSRMSVHLDEQQGRRVHGQTRATEVLHSADGEVVHHLKGGGHDLVGDDGGHGLGGRPSWRGRWPSWTWPPAPGG